MQNKIALIVIGLMIAGLSLAQAPNFDFPYFLACNSGLIVDDNVYVNPHVGDWDDDGDFDLMVGVFYNGNIFYYENTGTNFNPVFADYSMVYADGSPISVTYG